jgi:hypothetical protein
MTIAVQPHPTRGPGTVRVRVSGAAARAPTRVRMRIENGDQRLGPGGWQAADVWLSPDAVAGEDGDLLLDFGWSVCRLIDEGVYGLEIDGLGRETVYWPAVQAPTSDPAAAAAAERERLERERAERERAERERAEREKADRDRAAREQSEREKAEREKAERERAERDKAERDKAERERQGRPGARSWRARLGWPAALAALIVFVLLLTVRFPEWGQPPPLVPSVPVRIPSPPPDPRDPHVLTPAEFIGLQKSADETKAEGLWRVDPAHRDAKYPDRARDGLYLLQYAAEAEQYGPAYGELARLYDPSLDAVKADRLVKDANQAARYYRQAIDQFAGGERGAGSATTFSDDFSHFCRWLDTVGRYRPEISEVLAKALLDKECSR